MVTIPIAEGLGMEPKLAAEVSHHEYLLAQLREQFPDVDEETLADTLEGETNLNVMLAEIIRSLLDDVSMVTSVKARITDMQERVDRINDRARKKRDLVGTIMERADIKQLSEPDMTVSLRASPPPLIVTDETIIPDNYWYPQPPKLDRPGLKRAIKDGEAVPGAFLGNTSLTISIRTK